MKYIKKFSTNTSYNTFVNSGEYVTPNICYIEENKGLIIKPKSKPFFTVRDIRTNTVYGPYYFDEGMTGCDFLNSSYMDDASHLVQMTGPELGIILNTPYGYSANLTIVSCQEEIEAREYTVDSSDAQGGGSWEPTSL